MYLCRELTNINLTNIGKNLGNRDHTTIMYGIEKIQAKLDNKELSATIETIKKKLNSV